MKKALIFSFLILILAYRVGPAYAFSQSFQISVTIPAIPGVNIALEQQSSLGSDVKAQENKADQTQDNQNSEPKKPTILEIIEQKIIEKEEIVFITLIER